MSAVTDERLAMLLRKLEATGDGGYVNQLDELALALRELQQLRLATQWRAIETAPRDGARFLAYRRGEYATAYRVPRDDCEMWSFGGTSASVEVFPSIKPTHWMPLPDSPPPPKSEDV